MTDLTERLIALRDSDFAGNPLFTEAERDTLAEAAHRIAELEAAASSRHDPELPLTTRIALDRAEEAEAERDHYREALEVAYWAYANLERDRDTLAEAANRIAELEAERDRYREALEVIAKGVSPLGPDDDSVGLRDVARSALSEQEGE